MPLIDVIVASTDRDLTTTGVVRTMLGLSTAQTSEDANISASIRVASRWAETFIGYPLTVQTYRECLAAYGTRSLVLARTPVRAIPLLMATTSTDDGSQVLTSEYQLRREAGLIQRPAGWAWSVPSESYLEGRPLAGQEYPDWLTDYVAGWTLDGVSTGSDNWSTEKGTTSTGRTLPEDIERAVALRARDLYMQDEDVVEEKVGDLSVKYASRTSGSARPSVAESMLAIYARTA